jgi:hypothetical protein
MTGANPSLFYVVDWLPPDFGAVGQYGLIFAREIAESGKNVHLIGLTTGPSRMERDELPGGGALEISRLQTAPYNKSRNIERLLWTFRVNARLIRAVLCHPRSQNSDVLFTGAPPFMLFFALALKFLRNARLTYRITDFYPEVIIAERGKGTLGLRLLQRLTWFARRRIDAFEALGEDQRQILIRGGIPAPRISIKRDRSPIAIAENDPRCLPPFALRGYKILLYSGNYGVAHDVDTVVEGLKHHHHYGNARFGLWLNATGRNAETVASRLTAAQIPFAHTAPLELERLPSLLAAADVHLITLRPPFSGIVLPSKIYACLASRRPILFVGPASSDIHLLCLRESGLAYERVDPGDLLGFSNALNRFSALSHNVRMAMPVR